MSPLSLAIALVLLSAVLHATWNVLLKSSGNPLLLSTRAMTVGACVSTPLVVMAWLAGDRATPGLEACGLAVLSALLEVGYFVFLSSAYEKGELSSVYPLARGTAPFVSVLFGIALLRERLTAVEICGIALLLGGIVAARRPSREGAASVLAVLTGISIAAYSTVDQVGVHATQPWLYGWMVWVLTAVFLRLGMRLLPSSIVRAEEDDSGLWAPQSVVVGVLMTATYLLVLIAFRLAPLALISPLRESAVLLVTVWGIWRLGERDGMRLRIAGVMLILSGILVLALRSI